MFAGNCLAATAVIVATVVAAAATVVNFANAVYDYSRNKKSPENIVLSAHG